MLSRATECRGIEEQPAHAKEDRATRMRRRRRVLLVLDLVVLLTLGGIGMVGLICWPEYYVTEVTMPIALIVFYVIMR
jgi:hypothetical protein